MYIITAQCRVFSFVINKKKETNTKASKALSLLPESLCRFKALGVETNRRHNIILRTLRIVGCGEKFLLEIRGSGIFTVRC